MSRIQKLENIYKEQLKNHKIDDVSVFIQSILNADITKGKYARFLLDAFLNDKFLEEDLVGGLDSIVGQSISLFDKYKNKLPVHERSIYALNKETGEALYQSPGDLWNSVKQYQGELSGKELKREEQEKVYRETEFIYKDEDTGFQIVSPLTEESAKWWGKGTRWCTSAEKNNMFWDYAKDAPLFILLIPDNAGTPGNGNKLQLWKDENNIQFMDEADNSVSLEYIEQNWNILEPVCLWLNDLKFIPDKYKTKELYEVIAKENGRILRLIPSEYKTKELCEIAIKNSGLALSYIPLKYITKELCQMAVQQDGMALVYVPKALITEELCELAVKQDGMALVYIQKELRTKELCELAIKNNGEALKYVPDELITKELCELAIKSNGMILGYVPDELKTKELCELAVKSNGKALSYVPEKYKTKEFYEIAVKQNGEALSYVPDELKTKELCEIAVKQNGEALRCISNKYKTKEICELAVKQDGMALRFILYQDRTKELCEIAVQQNVNALYHVPEKYKQHIKKDLFGLPVKKYQEAFQKIKTFFPIKDISLDYHS
jgi:hypothetical protein